LPNKNKALSSNFITSKKKSEQNKTKNTCLKIPVLAGPYPCKYSKSLRRGVDEGIKVEENWVSHLPSVS
jgi:hypothetical protein